MRKTRRGNAMVVVLTFGVLLGFGALAVDIGTIRVASGELQAAVDGAALSASQRLDGTTGGITLARSTATSLAAANRVLGTSVSLLSTDVVIGAYDPDTAAFVPYVSGNDPLTVNAVRVSHQPPNVAAGLGAVAFGALGYTIQAQGMAIRPAGAGPASSTNCFLPLAVPDCHLAGLAPGTNPAPLKFTFSPTPTDSIAWGDPNANPNTSEINKQLQGQCTQGEIEIGDPIYVNEGAHNSSLMLIRDIINDITAVDPGVWDPALYGAIPPRDGAKANTPANSSITNPNWTKTLEGPVALVDAGSSCSSVSFTGSMEMTGVAWAVIYDVKSNGGGKNMFIQLDVVNEHEIWGDVDEDAVGVNILGTGSPALAQW